MHRSGVLAALTVIAVLSSCGGPGRSRDRGRVEEKKKDKSKIEVQAFLYDAKFLLRGTRRSVRLEVFKDRDRVALAGRGYLGKSALKGWMTADTLLVYFPGSNEYIYESTASLLASSACLDSLSSVNFPALFSALAPDVLPSPEFRTMATDSAKGDGSNSRGRSGYLITSADCPWEISLTYKIDSRGCRLRTIKYDSTTDHVPELEAKLRTFRPRVRVKVSRFEVDIPTDARRIKP